MVDHLPWRSVDATHVNAMRLQRDAGMHLEVIVDEGVDAAHVNAMML